MTPKNRTVKTLQISGTKVMDDRNATAPPVPMFAECRMFHAHDPELHGARAIRLAQTIFLVQVIGFKCFVYKYVMIKPNNTDSRVGTPGKKLDTTNAAA